MSRTLLRTGKTRRDLVRIAAIILASGFAVTAQQTTPRPVTKEDLVAGLKDPPDGSRFRATTRGSDTVP